MSKIKICDPACGSGSFLIEAYQYLLNWHLSYYLNNDPEKYKKGKEPKIFDSQRGLQLTLSERKRILINNIFGVDIDKNAVEVTKLSLLLKVLEYEGQEVKEKLLFNERILPDLYNNIKCGNSLIGSDYYKDKNLLLFENDDMQKINVFDWDKEFPEVFTQGGFDCVIGNPPYLRSAMLDVKSKNYYSDKYSAAIKQYDIYVLFIQKGIQLLKENGIKGYIVSNKFLVADYGLELRKYILNTVRFIEAIDVSNDNVFSQASVYPFIVIFQKDSNENSRNNHALKFTKNFTTETPMSFITRDQKNYYSGNFIFDFDTIGSEWIAKIEKHTPLCNYVNITRGFRPPSEDLKGSHGKERYLIGKDLLGAYYFHWSGNKVNYMTDKIPESKPIEIFKKQKIMFRDIGLKFNGAYDESGYLCLKTIYFMYLKEDVSQISLKYILGILNSKILYKYFVMKFSIMHISGGYLRFRKQFVDLLPMPLLDLNNQKEKQMHNSLVSLVDQMLATQQQLHNAKTESDKKTYQQKADIIDKQIDDLVYKLYDLGDDEIKIVEGR